MRIIEQIVDYLFQEGALSTEDEQYLADSGYIRARSWLSPDETRATSTDAAANDANVAADDPYESLATNLERAARSKSGRRSGQMPILRAQAIASRIRAARPRWAEQLRALQPLARAMQPGIDSDAALLVIGKAEPAALSAAVATMIGEQKGWLCDLWDALSLDEYRALVNERGAGPAVDAWNVLIRAATLQDLDRHLWILRHRQCAWVFQLRCAQARLLEALGILVARRDANLERELMRDSHPTGFWALALLYNGRRILQGHPNGQPLPFLSECKPAVPLPSAQRLGIAANMAAQMDREGLLALLRASARPQWRLAAMDYHNSKITIRDLSAPGEILLTVPAAGFCDVSPDGLRLAVSMEDGSLCVYDILSGRSASVSNGEQIGARRVVYCAGGSILATFVKLNDEWKLNLYDSHTLELNHSKELPYAPSGGDPRLETAVWQNLIAFTCQTVLQIVDVRTASLQAEIKTHSYYTPQAIAMSSNADMIVTVCSDGSEERSCIYAEHLPKRRSRTYRATAHYIAEVVHGYTYHMLFAPDGRTVVSAHEDGTVALIDIPTRSVRKEWKAHTGHATSLDMNEDGTLLLSSGEDGMVCLWDVRTGEMLQQISLKNEKKARIGQGLLRPVPRELQLVCPSSWRQPYPSRKATGASVG